MAVLTFVLQRKLPYKKMLIATGVLIALVLVVMVGQTARTMQGTGWLPITPLDWDIPPSLGLWFGVFPSVETIGAQVAAVVFVLGSYFIATELQGQAPAAARGAPGRPGARCRSPSSRPRSRSRTSPPDISAQYCADMSTKEQAELLVLVAGPYRGGTGDDPAKLAANVTAMNTAALDVFRAGHLPVTGEALALPLIGVAGSERIGDPVFDEIFHPIARRLLARCDAVLRIGGASAGADEMVAIARDQGKLVVDAVDQLALMLKEERHRRILELLETEGRLVAADLPERLGVSGHTVRRDLDELADASSSSACTAARSRARRWRARTRAARPRPSTARSPPPAPPPRCSSRARW